MDDYPIYGLLVGFSLWGTLWRLLFPLGFWPTFTCRVGTRGGTSTQPYTKEEEEKMAAILQERKEKEEAKKKALQEEQAAKLKKIEEEMAREKERLKKEEEDKLKEVEEEEEEGPPLQRRRGQHSGSKDEEMEKRISEWVANLSLGEEEEVTMYIPKDEQEAAMKEWEAEGDVLKRQAMEDEKRMEWKLAMMREKKKRVDAASEAFKDLEEVQKLTLRLTPQVDLQQKADIIAQSVERLARVQEQQYEFSRSQDIVVRSMRMGFRDFARELMSSRRSNLEVHEFSGQFRGVAVSFKVTSVIGHVLSPRSQSGSNLIDDVIERLSWFTSPVQPVRAESCGGVYRGVVH
ncbi:hypothetical protein CBR_g21890 [Chara braunii]|uniref:Uncharacterized protein n=1 Tax=Chara braunii TaxID=69332 RepID=A0A388L1P4_CHABU|nr:hypothetical protein CBR_g21890 [Chara braunii]|eukprot:GBG76142.1 hypothetical protein CBR_g21890 [Chara braunii]